MLILLDYMTSHITLSQMSFKVIFCHVNNPCINEQSNKIQELENKLKEKEETVCRIQQENAESLEKLITEHKKLMDKTEHRYQNEMSIQDSKIKKLQTDVNDQEATMMEVKQQIQGKDSIIATLQKVQNDKIAKISQLEGDIVKREDKQMKMEKELEDYKNSIMKLEQAVKEKEKNIKLCQTELAGKDQQLKTHEAQINSAQAKITVLQQSQQEQNQALKQNEEMLAQVNAELEEKRSRIDLLTHDMIQRDGWITEQEQTMVDQGLSALQTSLQDEKAKNEEMRDTIQALQNFKNEIDRIEAKRKEKLGKLICLLLPPPSLNIYKVYLKSLRYNIAIKKNLNVIKSKG